jgi:hypothetical protein
MKKIKLEKEHYALIIAAILIILFLLLYNPIEPTEDDEITGDIDTTHGSTYSASGNKLFGNDAPGMNVDTYSVDWDECCAGFVTASLTFTWDWNIIDDPGDDYTTTDEVEITIYDSTGASVYNSGTSSPTTVTKSIRGYYDCMTLWRIVVTNNCFPAITYTTNLNMVCD